ncbi:MAG: hypothetical protein WAO20_07655 [Acidobacteriota bacterium]|jgi:hypothetical protein
MKNAVRILVAPWYLLGWLSHVYLALAMPEIYRGFGNTALIPGFRELWRTVVMPEIVFFALALAAFELVVGILIIGKGTPVKYGLAASILFNLFLVQLGLAGQTADWVSDLLVNRLPNLVFIAIQIPLLFCTFERSLFEVLAGKWKNRAIQ